MRWRGNFSEKDTTHWTEEMKKLLNFDPNSASMFDNGEKLVAPSVLPWITDMYMYTMYISCE